MRILKMAPSGILSLTLHSLFLLVCCLEGGEGRRLEFSTESELYASSHWLEESAGAVVFGAGGTAPTAVVSAVTEQLSDVGVLVAVVTCKGTPRSTVCELLEECLAVVRVRGAEGKVQGVKEEEEGSRWTKAEMVVKVIESVIGNKLFHLSSHTEYESFAADHPKHFLLFTASTLFPEYLTFLGDVISCQTLPFPLAITMTTGVIPISQRPRHTPTPSILHLWAVWDQDWCPLRPRHDGAAGERREAIRAFLQRSELPAYVEFVDDSSVQAYTEVGLHVAHLFYQPDSREVITALARGLASKYCSDFGFVLVDSKQYPEVSSSLYLSSPPLEPMIIITHGRDMTRITPSDIPFNIFHISNIFHSILKGQDLNYSESDPESLEHGEDTLLMTAVPAGAFETQEMNGHVDSHHNALDPLEEDDHFGQLVVTLPEAHTPAHLHLTPSTFHSHISKHSRTVVAFYVKWCVHCKVFLHHFMSAVIDLPEKLDGSLALVHCWDWPDLCKQENVHSYPTVHLYPSSPPTHEHEHPTLPPTPLTGALDSRTLLKAVGVVDEGKVEDKESVMPELSHSTLPVLLGGRMDSPLAVWCEGKGEEIWKRAEVSRLTLERGLKAAWMNSTRYSGLLSRMMEGGVNCPAILIWDFTKHALHRAQVMESDKSIFSEKVQQVLDTFTEGNTEGDSLSKRDWSPLQPPIHFPSHHHSHGSRDKEVGRSREEKRRSSGGPFKGRVQHRHEDILTVPSSPCLQQPQQS